MLSIMYVVVLILSHYTYLGSVRDVLTNKINMKMY